MTILCIEVIGDAKNLHWQGYSNTDGTLAGYTAIVTDI